MTIDSYADACRTKKSRQAMADAMMVLAEKHGADVEINERDREMRVKIILGPYSVSADFDGASKVGAFLGHWNVASRSEATYPGDFGLHFCGTSVNEYHFQKATTCAYTFEDFANCINSGLYLIAIYLDQELNGAPNVE